MSSDGGQSPGGGGRRPRIHAVRDCHLLGEFDFGLGEFLHLVDCRREPRQVGVHCPGRFVERFGGRRYAVLDRLDEILVCLFLLRLSLKQIGFGGADRRFVLVRFDLEQKLSFENGVDAALVTTILDHIVVKKGSTRERVELEIFLKFGDPQRVIFSHRKTSDCFNPCS